MKSQVLHTVRCYISGEVARQVIEVQYYTARYIIFTLGSERVRVRIDITLAKVNDTACGLVLYFDNLPLIGLKEVQFVDPSQVVDTRSASSRIKSKPSCLLISKYETASFRNAHIPMFRAGRNGPDLF